MSTETGNVCTSKLGSVHHIQLAPFVIATTASCRPAAARFEVVSCTTGAVCHRRDDASRPTSLQEDASRHGLPA